MDTPVSAKAALLQALIEGESYGFELVQRVSDRTNGKITLRHGSVYPALRALEAEGLLKSSDGDPVEETGGRPRRYYELTAEGLRVAREQQKVVSQIFRLEWEGAR